VQQLDARALHEQFAGEVAQRAGAIGAIGERLGLRARERDQILHRARRNGRMHDQHVGRMADEPEVAEALERVVARLRHDVRIDRHRARRREQQRVAVGRRAGRRFRADRPTGARAVVDDELHAEGFGQLLRDVARHDVGRATGRKRHDGAHGFFGIRLGDRGGADGHQGRGDDTPHC